MFRGSIYCGRQFISHSLFLFEIGVVVMAEVFSLFHIRPEAL